MIIKIFEVGTYPQGRWDRERVEALVNAYDPENDIEAPCVVGHYSFGGGNESELAHGWVRSLTLNDQGEVWADVEAFEELRGWVATRRLGYVSVSIFVDDERDEKMPPRLAHVAFLGRSIPQIKTTRLPSLYKEKKGRDEDGSREGLAAYCVKIKLKKDFKGDEASLKEFSDAAGGDGGKAAGRKARKQKENRVSKEQERIAELEGQVKDYQAQLDAEKKRNADFAEKEAKAAVFSRVDALVKAGKLAPASRENFANAALSVPEGEGREAFFSAMEKTPVIVPDGGHFAEASLAADAPASMSNAEIREYGSKEGLSFEAAVEKLQREGRLV